MSEEQTAYEARLAELSDEQLLDEAEVAIWRAAVGESRGGHAPSYEYALAIMAHARHRHDQAGHDPRCPTTIYQRAFNAVTAAHGGHEPISATCDCKGVQA